MKNRPIDTIKIFIIFLCFLLSILASQAHAHRVIVTGAKYEGDNIRYNFSIDSWSENDNSPGMCANTDGYTVCNITISSWFANSYVGGGGWNIYTREVSTLGNMLVDLKKIGFSMPYMSSILVSSQLDQKKVCLGMGYSRSNNPVGGTPNLFGPCSPVSVVSPPVGCSITGDATINHNMLSDDNFKGNSAAQDLRVSCSGTSAFIVRTVTNTGSNRVWLRSDHSLYSTVRVNGGDATNGVQFSANSSGTPVHLSSTLSTYGGVVEPGAYSGTFVVIVDTL